MKTKKNESLRDSEYSNKLEYKDETNTNKKKTENEI